MNATEQQSAMDGVGRMLRRLATIGISPSTYTAPYYDEPMVMVDCAIDMDMACEVAWQPIVLS